MGRIINKFIAIVIALAGVLGAYSCAQSELQEMPEFITGVNVSIETPGIFELDEIATKVNYTVSGSNDIYRFYVNTVKDGVIYAPLKSSIFSPS